MNPVDTRFRVRYAETDQMGVVYHANYLVWMELGRVEYCREYGLRYRDLEEQGVLLAVVDVQCRYLRPARYDDLILVRTSVEKAHARLVRFQYSIRQSETDTELAVGTTTHVFLDRDLKPVRLPTPYHAMFGITVGA